MHKRRSKLVLALAATVTASLALAGCSGGGGEGNDDGTTEIIFWQQQFEDYQQAWFKKYVDEFNKSQDEVKVNYQVVPADAWQQKLQTAQAAGKQPDVATTNYGAIAAGVADGKFAALDDFMSEEAFADIKDNVSDFVTIDGAHYAYPMLVEPSTVLYYRADLAEAAGLDPNAPPTDWDGLIEWATALTNGDIKGFTIASTAPDLGWSSWGLQYNACGSLPIADDWSEATATDSCFEDLANFYKTLYQDGLIPQQPTVGYADGAQYGNEEVAMMAGGSWVVGQLKNDFPDLVEKTMVAPFPSIDGDQTKTTSTLGGWTMTLDSKSKNPEAAASFIEFLLAGDPEIMADFFKTSGFSKYTVRTSVDEALADDPEASSDPFMTIISEKVVPYGQAEPGYPWDISLAMGTAIESAMKGVADVKSSLETANAAINDVIEKQGLAEKAPN
jgi:multiple sugar transport system substrate-binding protein